MPHRLTHTEFNDTPKINIKVSPLSWNFPAATQQLSWGISSHIWTWASGRGADIVSPKTKVTGVSSLEKTGPNMSAAALLCTCGHVTVSWGGGDTYRQDMKLWKRLRCLRSRWGETWCLVFVRGFTISVGKANVWLETAAPLGWMRQRPLLKTLGTASVVIGWSSCNKGLSQSQLFEADIQNKNKTRWVEGKKLN